MSDSTLNATLPRSSMKPLAIKEATQLLPLALSLIGLTLLLVGLAMFNAPTADQTPLTIILCATPILFALAAGATSIGAEKESGTIQWLSWLPISPWKIVLVKWFVSLGYVCAMWFVVAILLSGMQAPEFSAATGWFIQSLLLLSCGMLTAWVLESAFASLIAIVPLASLPYVMTYVVVESSGRFWNSESQTSLSTSFAIGLFILATPLAWSAGVGNLRGADPWSWFKRKSGTEAADTEATDTEAADIAASQYNHWPAPGSDSFSSMASLWWQHGRWFAALIVGLVIAGDVSMWRATGETPTASGQSVLELLPICLVLAVAWLSVASINGDGTAARVRFLSDRGVSPLAIWLGRHLPPATVIVAVSIVLFSVQAWLRYDDPLRTPALSLLGLVGGGLSLYGVGAFVAMVFRPIAASTLLSPLLGGGAVAALIGSHVWVGVPLWIIVIAAAIPWMATIPMMRDFCRSSSGWRYGTTAAVAAVAFFGLLFGPAMLPILARSPVDARTIAAWDRFSTASAAKAVGFQRYPIEVHDPMKEHPDEMSDGQYLDLLLDSATTPEQLLGQMFGEQKKSRWLLDRRRNPAITLGRWHVDAFVDELTLRTFQLRRSNRDAAIVADAQRWFDVAGVLAAAGRRSESLESQQTVDYLEMSMTRYLWQLQRDGVVDADFAPDARRVLADTNARHTGRRRSVLDARKKFLEKLESDNYERSFGGIEIGQSFEERIWNWTWSAPHFANELTLLLTRLTDPDIDDAELDRSLRRLHEMNSRPGASFEDGPYGPKFRFNTMEQSFAPELVIEYPAAQWHAGWEDLAASLGESVGASSVDSKEARK